MGAREPNGEGRAAECDSDSICICEQTERHEVQSLPEAAQLCVLDFSPGDRRDAFGRNAGTLGRPPSSQE